jgi:hypothetical protein
MNISAGLRSFSKEWNNSATVAEDQWLMSTEKRFSEYFCSSHQSLKHKFHTPKTWMFEAAAICARLSLISFKHNIQYWHRHIGG